MKTPLGCGVGLRAQHFNEILETRPAVDWFEAVSENYMDTGGRPARILERVRERYPVALHGTALSIGSWDPLDASYLKRLRALAGRIDPVTVSDHLCWSGIEKSALHDLLPLPFTEEAVRHVVRRVDRVQNFLKRRILLENVSTYVTYAHSEMAEWEFVREVARRSGCGVLLDVNNVFVNAFNHKFAAADYLEGLAGYVEQIHLAGHTDMGAYLFDTHGAPVDAKVWELYSAALARYGRVSTLIEWDEHVPPLGVLLEEARKARAIYDKAPARNVILRRPKAVEESRTGSFGASRLRMTGGAHEGGAPAKAPGLREVQRSFGEAILPGGAAGGAARFLNRQGGAPGEARLGVYAGGYVARVREALGETFEAVRRAVGEDAFTELAAAYAERFGREHYNLNYAGVHFPDFLEKSAPGAKKRYLAELARFEWEVWQAFHAFDAEPMKPQDLAPVPLEKWERARVDFQPSARIFSSKLPVMDLWLAKDRDGADFDAIARRPAQTVLVARAGDQVRCEALDAPRAILLEALLAGRTLGSAVGILAKKNGDGETPVAVWFSNWVRDGLIRACRFGKTSPAHPRRARKYRSSSAARPGKRK